MTRQGKFKRAVRRSARESGQRYTQARAAMDKPKPTVAFFRHVEHAPLKAHLEERYRMRITSMAPIVAHGMQYPSTLLVERKDGPAWVARVFSSPADKLSHVEGDAEILRFLAAHDFPAERLAHQEPVSVLDGGGVIVTEFVEGGPPTDDPTTNTPETWHELASLLGRLHALPPASGAVARDGGASIPAPLQDGSFYIGRPKQDLAAAMHMLVSVEDAVAPERRDKFEWLRDQVENADDAEGLPEALTHHNYNGWAAVGKPGMLVIVGWAGAGRGPRLAALAWHLRTATRGDPAAVDYINAVVHGYSEHVRLTDQELDRLPGLINMVPLRMACGLYQRSVQTGYTPSGSEGWWPTSAKAEGVADKAVELFASAR
jgi:hypothetical protein